MTDQSIVSTMPNADSRQIENTTVSVPERLMFGHSLEWWNQWMLISLAVAALGAFAIAFTTTVVVKLQRLAEQDATRALESYKTTVAGQVAEANKTGVEAGKAAGNALLRAAALEKEAQDLKAKNLALEAKIQPRRLSGEDSKKLSSALSKLSHPPIGVVSRMFDSEGSDFADDLSLAFGNAHWQPVRFFNWTMSDKGVAIATLDGTSIPIDLEKHLLEALASVNIKAAVTTIPADKQNTISPHFQPNALYLLVGAKPQ